MSNIAGKVYAMNVVSPVKWYWAYLNRLIFWLVQTPFLRGRLNGLITLSLIHYARWAIVRPSEFPHLHKDQPKETIKYNYMFFFSNFNGSWAQYVDSFHMSIPTGLNLFWKNNVAWPKSVPLQPFHQYINYNQIWTNHYYTAYPMAASNDVKAAKRLKADLIVLMDKSEGLSAAQFKSSYDEMIKNRQNDISVMKRTPIVSLAAAAVERWRQNENDEERTNENSDDANLREKVNG